MELRLSPDPSSPGAVGVHDLHSQQGAFARQVLDAEAAAVQGVVIEPAFHDAVDLILARTGAAQPGALVVSGLGKSGLIGQKLTATFASTGTPSHFLHAAEALHGDLGRIRRHDVVLSVSFGGQTEELLALCAVLKQDGVPVIALVGRPASDLARLATVILSVGDVTEACPLNLAPTASTTAMLALGDALALCVMRRRNFEASDFHKFHPGGALGRQLMSVSQAMRFEAHRNLPLIALNATVEQAYAQAEPKAPHTRRAGALVVVDEHEKLAGIFTDGDLRRSFIKHGAAAWQLPIAQLMTRSPRSLKADELVRDAVHLVREYRIDEIPVVDQQGKAVGLIDVQDLVALKVIES
jgi:arabinose-5-phosphate isomerase